ncbi:glycoside hydrolase family 25 protein [Pontibacter ruber]|uniref:Glycoside hydrolase family 25 protein n=1 Tax=Pontibacter ruber TaxID=1343895 RepID=A0ABW5CSP3_9BACT|nr:glycoside hydrolase family 25 protein [Pontibacter ruber]
MQTSKAPVKKAPVKKAPVKRAPAKRKKQQKKQSPVFFWGGIAVLTAIALLVLYVEFFVDRKEPTVWPQGLNVRGIDVSKYQRDIDWVKVRESEVGFAFLKATEGARLKDSHFARNWEQTYQAGIIRGAYHFYVPHQKPEKQAKNFINTVKLEPGDLPPVLDVEVRGRKPIKEFRSDLKEWLVLVERAYGVKPILYTGYSFYKDHLEGYFDEYHLWIAHYKVPELALKRNDKTRLAFWQHTDNGEIDGIEGTVDCNIFYGSSQELRNICLKPTAGK